MEAEKGEEEKRAQKEKDSQRVRDKVRVRQRRQPINQAASCKDPIVSLRTQGHAHTRYETPKKTLCVVIFRKNPSEVIGNKNIWKNQ